MKLVPYLLLCFLASFEIMAKPRQTPLTALSRSAISCATMAAALFLVNQQKDAEQEALSTQKAVTSNYISLPPSELDRKAKGEWLRLALHETCSRYPAQIPVLFNRWSSILSSAELVHYALEEERAHSKRNDDYFAEEPLTFASYALGKEISAGNYPAKEIDDIFRTVLPDHLSKDQRIEKASELARAFYLTKIQDKLSTKHTEMLLAPFRTVSALDIARISPQTKKRTDNIADTLTYTTVIFSRRLADVLGEIVLKEPDPDLRSRALTFLIQKRNSQATTDLSFSYDFASKIASTAEGAEILSNRGVEYSVSYPPSFAPERVIIALAQSENEMASASIKKFIEKFTYPTYIPETPQIQKHLEAIEDEAYQKLIKSHRAAYDLEQVLFEGNVDEAYRRFLIVKDSPMKEIPLSQLRAWAFRPSTEQLFKSDQSKARLRLLREELKSVKQEFHL